MYGKERSDTEVIFLEVLSSRHAEGKNRISDTERRRMKKICERVSLSQRLQSFTLMEVRQVGK